MSDEPTVLGELATNLCITLTAEQARRLDQHFVKVRALPDVFPQNHVTDEVAGLVFAALEERVNDFTRLVNAFGDSDG